MISLNEILNIKAEKIKEKKKKVNKKTKSKKIIIDDNIDKSYKFIKLRKRNGNGYRYIWNPNSILKDIQKQFNNYLKDNIKFLPCIHAFVKNRDVRTNAKCHAGNTFKWKTDLSNFFDNVKEKHLKIGLIKYGIKSKSKINEIIKWCTRFDKKKNRLTISQGLPSSPVLANVACYDLDKYIMDKCKEKGYIYTRYSDDILISSNIKINDDVINDIKEYISNYDFIINKRKTYYINPGKRAVIAGILINNPQINVPKKTRKNLRARIDHIKKGKLNPTSGVISNLKGRISWVKSINKFAGNKLLKQLEVALLNK